MARTTAPSLWLPGFDPNAPETPEPSVEADLFADPPAPKAPVACAIQLAPAAIVADAPMDAEAETPSTAPRANWRVIASAKRVLAERFRITHATIEVERRGDVRRAKLYYLRELRGKKAKIKEKR